MNYHRKSSENYDVARESSSYHSSSLSGLLDPGKRMIKKMVRRAEEKPASDLAPTGHWYPTDPEIDKVLQAWDVIHPTSRARLREAVDKYLALLESGAPTKEIKIAKKYQASWWREYWKDMKKGIAMSKEILKK